MADFLIENNFLITMQASGIPAAADPIYEPRAVFSINASNQLQGTFWITKNGTVMKSDLGTASYAIRDKDRALIGISETGLTPDINGLYEITPVSASLILDLTHYTVDLEISADSDDRDGVVGITTGE